MSFKVKLIEKIKFHIGLTPYEEPKGTPKTLKGKVFEFINSLWKAGLAAMLIISFLFQNTRIPTGSMETTILVGDFVIVNKFVYGSSSPRYIPFTEISLPFFSFPSFSEPKRGDIVVFEYPGDRDDFRAKDLNVNYVKRCVAGPGDTIEIKDKVVYINGKENWIPPNIQYRAPFMAAKGQMNTRCFPKGRVWNEDNYGALVIPKKGMRIEMNLQNTIAWKTTINREIGHEAVTLSDGKAQIDGKEVTEYIFKKDYYFMMGDNRDDSLDSRYWGCVPRDMIVGRASIVLFSWDRDISFSEPIKLLASIRPERILRLLN